MAARAGRCTASPATTGSSRSVATARSPTARSACGCSPSDLPGSERRVLAALRENAAKHTVRLWAPETPFALKDVLSARGYRWMPRMSFGIDRAWWTELAPERVDAELEWLRETVYASTPMLPVPQRRVTAFERWRANPADVPDRASATSTASTR